MAPKTIHVARAPRAARQMAEAATALLASLVAEQRRRSCATFDGDERYPLVLHTRAARRPAAQGDGGRAEDAALQLVFAGSGRRRAAYV